MPTSSLPCIAAAFSLTVAAAAPVCAQTFNTLKETVVTASRISQPLTDVVADVSIMDRAQIEALGAISVTQLLARLPGVQSIGFADASRIYIRGADSRMTALYLDGVRVDSQDGVTMLGGGAPWDLIPVSQIERIEVLRGPASAVYGADAMGGVIQIFTKRGEAGFTPYANLGAGSMNLRRVDAGFSGAQGGWDYALGLGLEDSGGYNTRPDLIHTPEREPSASRTATARLGYQLGAAHRVEFGALSSTLDSRYVPYGGGVDYTAHAKLDSASLKWKARWSDVYSTNLTFSRSEVTKRDDVPNDYRTTLQGVLFENNVRLSGGLLSAVLEHKKDDFDAQPSAYDPAFSGHRTQNAAGLGYGATFGPHTIQLNARNDHDSNFGDHQTGLAAYAFAFSPQWRGTVSTGTAFRAPSLEQTFGPYGSSQLSPETNRSSEIGLGYSDSKQSFKAVAYRNVVTNMISSNAASSSCAAGFFCYFNVGRASIQGFTLSGARHFNNFNVHASLDMLDPRDDMTGRTLSLRARKTLSLGVDRRVGAWRLSTDLQAVGERFNDAANTTVLPGYALLNLGANTQLNPDWKLVSRIENLADVRYEQVAQYATPGRTVYLGVQWTPNR